MPKRFEIYWVNLDPTVGAEIKKTRPCVIISPDEMNEFLRTVIVAPITSTDAAIPTRIQVKSSSRNSLANDSYIVMDQIKTIDKQRLAGKMGKLTGDESRKVSELLCEMFAL